MKLEDSLNKGLDTGRTSRTVGEEYGLYKGKSNWGKSADLVNSTVGLAKSAYKASEGKVKDFVKKQLRGTGVKNQRRKAELAQTVVNKGLGTLQASRTVSQSSDKSMGSQATSFGEAVVDIIPFSSTFKAGAEIQRRSVEMGGEQRLEEYIDENPHSLF